MLNLISTAIFILCFFSTLRCEYTHALYLPANNATTKTRYSRNSPTIHSTQSCSIQPSMYEMTRHQLEIYCAHHSEQQIFSNPCLFTSDEFCAYAKQLPGYAEYVKKYYEYYKDYPLFYKAIGIGLTDTYTWDLENKLKQLYREVLREEQKQLPAKPSKKITLEQFAQRQKQKQLYKSLLDTSEHLSCIPANHLSARRHVVNTMHREHTKQVIPVNDTIIEFAEIYGISKQQLVENNFNEYQYQLHTEFLEQLGDAIYFALPTIDYTYDIGNILGETIALGIEANHNNDVTCATHMANLGWALLDIAQGVAEGLAIGASRTSKFAHDILRHPVKTTCDIAHGIGTALYCLGKIVEVPIKLQILYEMGDQEQTSIYEQEIINTVKYLKRACKDRLESMSDREIARETTALCTDWLLTGKAIQLSGKALSHFKPLAHETFEILKREPSLEYAVAGAEGIVYQMSESLEKIGSTTKIVSRDMTTKELFQFGPAAAKHMEEAGRMIPVNILDLIIKNPLHVAPDPRGLSQSFMYYSRMWVNKKLYNVEVLYDKSTNTIEHFLYRQHPLGPLPKIQ